MDLKMENGLKIREVIGHIERCKEERKLDPKVMIEAPGLGWNGTEYCKILEEEKVRLKPKKQTPIEILI